MGFRLHTLSTSAAVLLLACGAGVDDIDETDGDTGGTGVASSGEADGGETVEVDVCGNGILEQGEACDPPGDGCDAECNVFDRTVWEVGRGGVDAPTVLYDVAIDRAGQIVVLGATLDDPEVGASESTWLLALDSDGAQQWTVQVPPAATDSLFPLHVAADGEGIYVQGYGVHRFSRRGEPGWYTWPSYRAFTRIAVADGAVYAAGVDFSAQSSSSMGLKFALHRLDAASGALVWERVFDEPAIETYATGVAVAGGTAHAVGGWESFDPATRGEGTMRLSVDVATGEGAFVRDEAEEWLYACDSVVSGDLMVAGMAEEGLFVRRLAPTGAVRWTTPFLETAEIRGLVTASDESAVLYGTALSDAGPRGYLRALSGTGSPTWSVTYAPGDPANGVSVAGAAFGPDFLVVVGQEYRSADQLGTAWIRRLSLK